MIMKTELKFKVGDKVRVKSLEWYNENKNFEGNVYIEENTGIFFAENMSKLCGQIVQIIYINGEYSYHILGNKMFWQDWMFEDEVITEEKQEVEQLNQNSMETKEMTQKEIFEYLNNTKILCTSTEESTNVQQKLFELGYSFRHSGKKILSTYLLYIIDNFKLLVENYYDSWVKNESKMIYPSEILAIQIKEEKPKFDPKTLRPFDKVLIRDKEGDKWRCNLFCHINEELLHQYFCVFDNWIYCIPFNEETKHLVGTTDEAPEFYRI